MSKHSHSIEFRLGLFQLWKMFFNVYGTNFKLYTVLLQNKLKIKIYTEKLCLFVCCPSALFEYTVHSKYIILVIYYSDWQQLNANNTFFNVFQQTYKMLYYWTKVPIYYTYYKQKNWLNFAFLIAQYINYFFTYNKFSIKLIFKKLKPLLLNQLSKKIVSYSITGTKVYNITGIKIYCHGRLGGARNPLSQTIKEIIGSLPLPKLNGYLDYVQDLILTKYGIYGIRIWIFYS